MFLKYRGLAFAVAARYTANRHDREDVVQEAFARAFAGIDQLRDRQRFGAWLATIVRFVAIDRARANSRVELTDSVPEPMAGSDPYEGLPSEVAELRSLIIDSMGLLSERDAAIVRMIVNSDVGPSEVAIAFGISRGAAKVAAHRARTRLRASVSARLLSRGGGACSPEIATSGHGMRRHVIGCAECRKMADELLGVPLWNHEYAAGWSMNSHLPAPSVNFGAPLRAAGSVCRA